MGWRCHFDWSRKKEGTRVKSSGEKGNGAGKSYDVIGAIKSFFDLAVSSVFMVSVFKEWVGTSTLLFWRLSSSQKTTRALTSAGPTLWTSCGQRDLDTGYKRCFRGQDRMWYTSCLLPFNGQNVAIWPRLHCRGGWEIWSSWVPRKKNRFNQACRHCLHKSYCVLSSHCNIWTIY